MSDLQNYLNERLQNPAFKEHWEDSRLEFEVARQLILLRKQAGLTQEELANRLHTQQSEISRIENGDQNISLEKLRNMVKAMGGNLEIHIEMSSSDSEWI